LWGGIGLWSRGGGIRDARRQVDRCPAIERQFVHLQLDALELWVKSDRASLIEHKFDKVDIAFPNLQIAAWRDNNARGSEALRCSHEQTTCGA